MKSHFLFQGKAPQITCFPKMPSNLLSVNFKYRAKATPRRRMEWPESLNISSFLSPEEVSPVHEKKHLGSLGTEHGARSQETRALGPAKANRAAGSDKARGL